MYRPLRILFLTASAALTVAATPGPGLATAVFAGGCFWSMEHDMEKVAGVTEVVSGYTGGRLANPTYEDVVTETTGHYEAVRVAYDPRRISYAQLADAYFRTTDPTDAGGAFCDRGESYGPAIFATPQQRVEAEAAKARAAKQLGRPLATKILAAARFYPAESYHQNYAARNRLHYGAYRVGCGKDRRLTQLWGKKA